MKPLFSIDFLPIFFMMCIAAFQLSINIYIPTLPTLEAYFQVDREDVQLSVVGFLLGSALSGPVYGILSDRYGRKPLFTLGLWVFWGASTLSIFAPSMTALIFLRTLQGAGAGCISVLCFCMIQEAYSFKKANVIIGWSGVVRELFVMLSPILGGYLVVGFGWRSTFFVVFFILLVLLYCSRTYLQETYTPPQRQKFSLKPIFKDCKTILTDLSYIRYMILFPFLFCGLWCYLAVIPFYAISFLHVPVEKFGYYMAPTALSYSLGSLLSGSLIKWGGLNRTLTLGLYLCLCASGLHLLIHYAVPGRLAYVIGVQCVYMVGSGFVFAPSIMQAVYPFHEKRATATALGALFRQLFGVVGGMVGGHLEVSNLLQMSLFLIFLSLVALFVFKSLVPKKVLSPSQ